PHTGEVLGRDDAALRVGRDLLEEGFRRLECSNLGGFATYDVRNSSAFVVRLVDDEDGVTHDTATGREHPQQATKWRTRRCRIAALARQRRMIAVPLRGNIGKHLYR